MLKELQLYLCAHPIKKQEEENIKLSASKYIQEMGFAEVCPSRSHSTSLNKGREAYGKQQNDK